MNLNLYKQMYRLERNNWWFRGRRKIFLDFLNQIDGEKKQRRILGKELYRNKCGHVQSFGPASLKALLQKYGFRVEKQFSLFRFILFAVAEKLSA